MNSTLMDPFSADQPFALNKTEVYTQTINITDRYGQTSTFPLWYLDALISDAVVHAIIPAVQFGASLMLFLVLLLLSKHDKRRSPVFIFTTAALFFNIVYALLQCCITTSSYWDVYPLMVGDYAVVTAAAHRLTAAASVFVTLVALCIEASLVLQIYVVGVTLPTWQRMTILAVSMFVAIIAAGFRVAQSVVSVQCLFHEEAFCASTTWLAKAKDISLTVSICFFSAVFCTKLGWSLRERRKLGMKQFGSMQVIFIGGFQTMIIPAIFSIIQLYKAKSIPNIGSNILTVTCISLPLTSLWASSHAAAPSKAARGHDFHRKFLVDSSAAESSFGKETPQWESSASRFTSGREERLGVLGSVDSKGTVVAGHGGWGKVSPGRDSRDVERDLEMQELKERE